MGREGLGIGDDGDVGDDNEDEDETVTVTIRPGSKIGTSGEPRLLRVPWGPCTYGHPVWLTG